MAGEERERLSTPNYPPGTLVFKRDEGRRECGVVTFRSYYKYFELPERVVDRSILMATGLSREKGLCSSSFLLGRPRGWKISNHFHTGEEEVTVNADFVEVGRGEQSIIFNNVWFWLGGARMPKSRRVGAVMNGLAEAVEVAFIPVFPIQRKGNSGGVLVISTKDLLNERYGDRIREFLGQSF